MIFTQIDAEPNLRRIYVLGMNFCSIAAKM